MARHAETTRRPYAAPRTKGPGRHAIAGPRVPAAELLPVPVTDAAPLATRAPLPALVAVLVALAIAIGLALTATQSAAAIVEPAPVAAVDQAPAESCGDYCGTDADPMGTDAGLITTPAR